MVSPSAGFIPATTHRIIPDPQTVGGSLRHPDKQTARGPLSDAMHEKIPDINDTELWVIRQAVTKRNEYTGLGEGMPTQLRVQADYAAKRG